MRIMALDYGDSRTGVAVSDAGGLLVGDAFVVAEKNPARLAARIQAEVQTRSVERIVLGLPRNMNGTEGPRAAKSRALGERLAQLGLELVYWDERLTTVDAARVLHDSGRHGAKNRRQVDAVAASLILEGYLRSLSL